MRIRPTTSSSRPTAPAVFPATIRCEQLSCWRSIEGRYCFRTRQRSALSIFTHDLDLICGSSLRRDESVATATARLRAKYWRAKISNDYRKLEGGVIWNDHTALFLYFSMETKGYGTCTSPAGLLGGASGSVTAWPAGEMPCVLISCSMCLDITL